VTADAYQPTGVAVGYPLPDPVFTERLWRVARVVAGHLRKMRPDAERVFAFVPSPGYHATLVNRTHFDLGGPISQLNAAEAERVTQAVANEGGGPVVVDFHGLLLTRHGRLVVTGFPVDGRFFDLRDRCCEAVAALAANLPETAHIKLGHVLVPLQKPDLPKLLSVVTSCAEFVSARVKFEDLYTPVRRIHL
jgi:hypothetical protein